MTIEKQEDEIKSKIDNILPYIEPNKQLKDVDQGRFSEKVNFILLFIFSVINMKVFFFFFFFFFFILIYM